MAKDDSTTSEIYVIIGGTGAYEDAHTWTVAASTDKATAEAYEKQLNAAAGRCTAIVTAELRTLDPDADYDKMEPTWYRVDPVRMLAIEGGE